MVTISSNPPRAEQNSMPVVRFLMLIAAAALLLVAARLPWWGMLLYAPQYPQGLEIVAYLHNLAGDVYELDLLNHYIGMMPLADAAPIERSLVKYAVPLFAGLSLLSFFIRHRVWAWVMRLPLLAFPLVFLADLSVWMWYAGNHLDPNAPMNHTIQGFTPTVLGPGRIAQFTTHGFLEPGFWLAMVAVLLTLAAGMMEKPAAPDAGP